MEKINGPSHINFTGFKIKTLKKGNINRIRLQNEEVKSGLFGFIQRTAVLTKRSKITLKPAVTKCLLLLPFT